VKVSVPGFVLLVSTLLCGPTTAGAVEHTVSVALGAPVPLTFYGYGEVDDETSVRFLGYGSVDYAVTPGETRPFYLGAWVGGGVVLAKTGSLAPHMYVASLGLQALIRERTGGARWSPWLRFSLGPGVLFQGLFIDGRTQRDTVAVGLRMSLGVEVPVTPSWGVGLLTAVELYSAPLNHDRWFNKELGETRFVTISAAATWGSVPYKTATRSERSAL